MRLFLSFYDATDYDVLFSDFINSLITELSSVMFESFSERRSFDEQ